MKPYQLFLLLSLVLCSPILSAQEKYSTVKIYAPTEKFARTELIGLLELDHFQPVAGGAIIAEIGQKEIARLQQKGYAYDVLVDDVASHVAALNRSYYASRASGIPQNRLAFEETGSTVASMIPAPSTFEVKSTFGGYYSFAEMNTAMNNLVANYPAIAQKTSIGTTHGGRNIWCIKISDAVATDESNEPEVLYLGVQHAREAIGGSSLIFFMEYLCENYSTDPRVKALVDNREIFIIPCMNPDGWEYNRLNGGAGSGWRKNRRNNGDGTYGVDLNRNWGVDWGNCSAPISGVPASCGSTNTSSDTYFGTSPFSEPETQAIRDFTYTRQFVAMIDQHAYGPYYSLPFGRPSLPSNVMPALDEKFYTYVSAAMGNYNGMRAGNSLQALNYEVAGGVKDWMLKGNVGTGSKGKVYGMTGEGGAGAYSATFWPPASQIINLCQGMVFQNIQLLLAAGSYVNLQDRSDINLTSLTGTLDFHAIRVGLQDQPVTISVIPMQNIQSVGAPVIINSFPDYADAVDNGIAYVLPPAIGNGQRIQFAWRIETGGMIYYDTVTKFYNAQTLLYDNMDGTYSSNWTSGSGWGFTSTGTGIGGGSSRAMSESPSGNYAANSTRRSTYNSTIDLQDATAAFLSFWVRHRAENFRDKLQVQVSTDGTNWTALVGTTTVQEPGTRDGSTIDGQPALTGIKEDWTRELFDLRDFIGAPALQLRFEFTSDNNSTGFDFQVDDGFYIDELKLVKSTATLVTLPVQFNSFTGRLQADKTVRLEWQAETDALHDYFEIERSSNGTEFTTLGRGPASPAYWFIDPAPQPGNNYYRIRQFDKDGSFTYSTLVNVIYQLADIKLAVYPNPARDLINAEISAPATGYYTLTVTDMSGRLIKSFSRQLNLTRQEISIPLPGKGAGLYMLTVRNGKNEVIGIRKFVRE